MALAPLGSCRKSDSNRAKQASVAPDALPIDSRSQPDQGGAPSGRAAGTSASFDYQVAGRRITLKVNDDACRLSWSGAADGERELALDLSPPCYLLLWQGKIPAPKPDQIPLGSAGEPMAFRYRARAKEQTIAIAAIGDPVSGAVSKSDRAENARRLGYHCAGSAQGIIFRGDRAEALKKRPQVGLFCVEIPIDQASFWLTTHN